jgi:hypothetical protein
MNEKIKLNKIPANDLLPYDYRIFMVLSEFENILSQTTRDLMMKNSKGFTHKHVHKTEPKILFDVEKEADELCESSSFKEYNLVFENFISQTIRHGHERYHHETLILDASLNHVCLYLFRVVINIFSLIYCFNTQTTFLFILFFTLPHVCISFSYFIYRSQFILI